MHMQPRPFLLAALALAAFALPARDVAAGESLPPVELEEFAQTKAKTFGDLTGRAVLIEFFAYW